MKRIRLMAPKLLRKENADPTEPLLLYTNKYNQVYPCLFHTNRNYQHLLYVEKSFFRLALMFFSSLSAANMFMSFPRDRR